MGIKLRAIKIFLIIAVSLGFLACDTDNTIIFRNDPTMINRSPKEITNGGMTQAVSGNGSSMNVSVGSKTSNVVLTAPSGFQIQMNIQGQIAK